MSTKWGSKRLKNDDLEQESTPIKIFGLTRNILLSQSLSHVISSNTASEVALQ